MPKKFQLSNLDIGEVSLVDRAAIKRNFSVIKADDSKDSPDNSEDEPESVEESMADKDKEDDLQTEEEKPEKVAAQKDGDFTDEQKTSLLGKLAQFMGLDSPTAEETPKDTGENDDGDDDMAEKGISKADLDSAVQKAVTLAVTEARKADQEEISTLKDSAARREFADHVTAKNWGGDHEANVDLMLTMKRALSEEDYTKWLEREDTRAAEVEKSGLFAEIGSHLAKSQEGIEAEVEKARKEGTDYDKIVDSMDPKEYMEYQKEQERKIKRSYLGG